MNNQQRNFLVEKLAQKFIEYNRETKQATLDSINSKLETLKLQAIKYVSVDVDNVDVYAGYDNKVIFNPVINTSLSMPPSLKKKLTDLANQHKKLTNGGLSYTDKQRTIIDNFQGELLFNKDDYETLVKRIDTLFKQGAK